MPRPLRIEYPSALYHVANRGSRGATVFLDDLDRELFLRTLTEAREKAGWEIHALCLMPDHFHAVIETPQANLVSGMKWFLGTYTNRFNRRHRTRGHVFAGRYRGVPIASAGSHFAEACDYVHLNPVRAGLVSLGEPLESYPWSSYPAYLRTASERPRWLATGRLLGVMGCGDSGPGRREFARRLELRRQTQDDSAWSSLRRGWFLGDDAFRHALMDRLIAMQVHARPGQMRLELARLAADRIIAEELRRLGMEEAQLARRPKTAPEKIGIAARLRRETVLSIRWIASRLSAGSPNTLRNSLHRLRHAPPPGGAEPRIEREPGSNADRGGLPRREAEPSDGFSVAWD